ncbi:MAG: biotin synthase BioB [Planctomycetaceae bacterium]
MATLQQAVTPIERWTQLAQSVLEGHPLTTAEATAILESSDEELLPLLHAAFQIRSHYFGKTVQLYTLKNAKSGLCPEDCNYCSQSAVSDAPIERYAMLSEERLLEGARQAVAQSSKTYCIVASGRGPSNREVDHVAKTVRRIKDETGLHICCCLGILTPEQATTLKAAGVDRINHNLNTSREFHEKICSTHSFDDRLQTLKVARDAGLELCAGLIVGMGETNEDVVQVAFNLRELEVESIPVNFLNAIDGTPLEGTHQLDPRYCLKTLCLFRFTNPSTEIRIAGGREVQLRSMQAMGLYPANSLFVSDYLTTKGQAADADHQMIADMGFEVIEA